MALAASPRLDQIAALDRLVNQAKRGAIRPADGLRQLEQIREMHNGVSGGCVRILGYAVFTVGVCLILRPALRRRAGRGSCSACSSAVLRSIGTTSTDLAGAHAGRRRGERLCIERHSPYGTASWTRGCGQWLRHWWSSCRRRADHCGARAGCRPDDLRVEPSDVGLRAAGASGVRHPRRHRGSRRDLRLACSSGRRTAGRVGSVARRVGLRGRGDVWRIRRRPSRFSACWSCCT